MAEIPKEIVSLDAVVRHSGIGQGMLTSKRPKPLSRMGRLLINGREADVSDTLKVDDLVAIGETQYRVIAGGPSRLQLDGVLPEGQIKGKIRAHCGLHIASPEGNGQPRPGAGRGATRERARGHSPAASSTSAVVETLPMPGGAAEHR